MQWEYSITHISSQKDGTLQNLSILGSLLEFITYFPINFMVAFLFTFIQFSACLDIDALGRNTWSCINDLKSGLCTNAMVPEYIKIKETMFHC